MTAVKRLRVCALLLALLPLLLALLPLLAAPRPVLAVELGEVLNDPALETRARALSKELRCMVCQNQSIDDSEAPLAHDLRVLVRERLQAGDSDAQVIRPAMLNRLSPTDVALEPSGVRMNPNQLGSLPSVAHGITKNSSRSEMPARSRCQLRRRASTKPSRRSSCASPTAAWESVSFRL